MLQIFISKEERPYFGPELRPHFLLSEMGLRGSAMGVFVGPCEVKTDHLVDWEDRMANDHIAARKMVHFLGEFFGMGLREGVFMQRLFMASLCESLNAFAGRLGKTWRAKREGDDIFIFDPSLPSKTDGPEVLRKLSVSIVTASPVSILMHAGINLDPTGAPVAAVGLDEMGVPLEQWLPFALDRFKEEWESIHWACAKVRPVV